jgi:acyl-CoA thioester hydrolase
MDNRPFKSYTPIKVRYNETDLQGHVYFGNYLSYFDLGVDGYMSTIGYDYQKMLADQTDFLYAESHCSYKSPARFRDILRVYTRVDHLGQRSLRFEFEVRAEPDDRLVATGHIVAVTADKTSFKPQPMPDGLRQAIVAYEEANLAS